MIAVDTNILVYVHREDSPWHKAAYSPFGRTDRKPRRLSNPVALCA